MYTNSKLPNPNQLVIEYQTFYLMHILFSDLHSHMHRSLKHRDKHFHDDHGGKFFKKF